MANSQYNLAEYRTYLERSHEKHLLVEGRDDKRIFTLFLDELLRQMNSQITRPIIWIDSAECLIEPGSGIGNREKVEIACESVSNRPCAERLVGFVDRDFREFDRIPTLQDRLGGHRVSGRLVWSRGHSIENYCFDFETVRGPLRDFSLTDQFCTALSLFEAVFEQTIRLACAASLAGDELQKLDLVKSSVDQKAFDLCSGSGEILTLNLDIWEDSLTKRHHVSTEIARNLIERLRFWNDRVAESDFRVARWMCHGHIGLAFIWAVYSRCVLEACEREGYDRKAAEAEAQRVLKAEESVRFNACAALWVQRALGNHCSYPAEVFRLLDLDLPSG